MYASRRSRFKFNLRSDEDINHSVYIGVFFIDRAPIRRIVEATSRYQAARWLDKVSALALWTALRLCRIDVYFGPPLVITHDAANATLGKEF